MKCFIRAMNHNWPTCCQRREEGKDF